MNKLQKSLIIGGALASIEAAKMVRRKGDVVIMDDLEADKLQTQHVRLSSLATQEIREKASHAIAAADKVADEGGSPRAQLDAAREATGKRLTYVAHCGSRQKQRALDRMRKAEEKKNNGNS